MLLPKAKVSFQIASLRRPQEEYNIRVDNYEPFQHAWMPRSEDGSRLTHPLEKVMEFIDKKVSDAETAKPRPVECTPLKLVQDINDLKELAAKLRDTDDFSVDLKQNQYRSFQGLTCLMQISTRTEDFIVDTLKLRVQIGPHLREVFEDPTKRKVMHGASQYIIWLQRDFGIYVCNMFDTEQASKVLKLEGDSLEYLLRHFCKFAANEEYKNADWRLRTLTDEMLRYVREDTHSLLYIYDLMQRRLLSSPTDPDCPEAPPLVEVYKRSYDICMQLYEKETLTKNSYLNIHGLHHASLNGQQLAIAAGLCEWRDNTAREEDESTDYILPNEVLIEIAKQIPGEFRNLLKLKHPHFELNLDYLVSIITHYMQEVVPYKPVAMKLKEEHIEMMAARNSVEKEVGNFISGAYVNLKFGWPKEYNIWVNNSYDPFPHLWLLENWDGSSWTHPFEELSVMDFIDKTTSDAEPVKPPPVESTPFKLVQDVKDLKELAAKLHNATEFAVDLKQNQYRSFQGLTCLMQISTRTEDFIVDTLKLRVHIGPHLRQVFKDPTKRKIMHGAYRCILWLQRDFGIYVCNMFDTEQASNVLKLKGDSLDYLLRHFCKVASNIEYKNADRRLWPLTDEMLSYAREDTHYLLYIYDLMLRRLLSSPTVPGCLKHTPLYEVYQRSYSICMQLYEKGILTKNTDLNIYGLHAAGLNDLQLAVVAGLCDWRDFTARKEDESTDYIMPNEVLIETAKQIPGELGNLLKSTHACFEGDLDYIVSIVTHYLQNFVAYEPVAMKLKEEHNEMMAARNAKFANSEKVADVAGSVSTSDAVEDISCEKEVGNFVVGANQNLKLDGSSATEEIKVEQIKSSVSLPCHSSTDKTEQSHESDGATDSNKKARPLFPCHHTVTVPVGDRHITVETGKIGRQASGSVTIGDGGTFIYTTICISDVSCEPSDFFPMRTYYKEYLSAAGKTSGGYFKREGKMMDHEVLICRQIDRALRPTMCKGFCRETQIDSMVLSYDGLHSPDSLAITAAGIAVSLSQMPNTNTVVGVRIGLIGDKFVVNPTTVEMKESKLDLLLAGSETGILMIEGCCDFLPEEKLLQAIEVGQDAVRAICKEVDNLVKICGKPKMLDSIKLPPPALYKHVEEIAGDELVNVLQIKNKVPIRKALSLLEDKVLSILTEEGYVSKSETCVGAEITPDMLEDEAEEEEVVVDGEFDVGDVHIKPVLKKPVPTFYSKMDVKLVFKSVCSKYLRQQIVKGGKRSDGRSSEEIRLIDAECGMYSGAHGSALFTRGETQSSSVVTLGDKRIAQRIENLVGVEDVKRFYLQYKFRQSSVGGVERIGPPSRREIGHGALAERALKPTLPSEDDFPYTIRVESTITESNGSSSMASVCGGCLALQDAGVPLKSSIAGIAMGMILDTKEYGGDGTPLILSDITGSEDASGDMDFKVAGNDDGVTAFQMDIKVDGISLAILKQALLQAKEGRRHIHGEMLKCSPSPSKKLAKHAPLILAMKVKPEEVSLIIGYGGKNVKSIIEVTGVEYIDTQDNGTVQITSSDLASLEKAKAIISNLTKVPVVGDVYRNRKITCVVRIGIFVEIALGQVGLCRFSEFNPDWLSKPDDAFKVGDLVDVKLIEINEKGQLCLSGKALLSDQGTYKPNENPRIAGGSKDGGRSGC